MAGPLDIGNLWKILGTKGNQMNPAVAAQLAEQAAPSEDPSANIPQFLRPPQGPSGIPPMLDAQMPLAQPAPAPPEPQVVEVNYPENPYSVQPTTSPIGSLPQEMQPSQPALADPSAPPPGLSDAMRRYQAAYDNFKLPSNSAAMKQLGIGEQNYNNSQMAHQAEIDKMKAGLANYAAQDTGINFTPLAALSDSWFGSKLSQAAQAMAPETAAKKAQNIVEMQRQIAAAQGELPKEQSEYMKNKLAQMGYMDERALKAEVAKLNAAAKIASTGQTSPYQAERLKTQQQRMEMQKDNAAASAADKFDNDAIIKKNEAQRQQIELDKHTLDTAKVLTPQIFNEIQIGLARAISGGTQTAVATQEKVEFNSLQTQLQALKQRVTNRPQDIDSPEVRTMLSDTMSRLGEAYENNMYARAQQLRKGREKAFTHNPRAIEVMDAKVEAYKPAQKEVKPKVIIQNGHEYTLNPQTGAYE